MFNDQLILFVFVFLSVSTRITPQSEMSHQDSAKYKINIDNQILKFNDNLKGLGIEEIDTIKFVLPTFDSKLDSVKYLYELKILWEEECKKIDGFNLADKYCELKRRRKFLLLTSREYYNNKPDLSLGEVGRYLGVSKKIAAIILAIISL